MLHADITHTPLSRGPPVCEVLATTAILKMVLRATLDFGTFSAPLRALQLPSKSRTREWNDRTRTRASTGSRRARATACGLSALGRTFFDDELEEDEARRKDSRPPSTAARAG